MRIWDINPGYLNRQSLLGEHRELHGIVSIILYNKKGYSHHPETLRWKDFGWALQQRHKLLVAEMLLRGYNHHSPVLLNSKPGLWPQIFIDKPARQITLLQEKYQLRESGRIPLPKNAQEFWAHHKYSVMARDHSAYKFIGKWVSVASGINDLPKVALDICEILRMPPRESLIKNTLLHLWGYVSNFSPLNGSDLDSLDSKTLLKKIQDLSRQNQVTYLIHSTVLSDLIAWDNNFF